MTFWPQLLSALNDFGHWIIYHHPHIILMSPSFHSLSIIISSTSKAKWSNGWLFGRNYYQQWMTLATIIIIGSEWLWPLAIRFADQCRAILNELIRPSIGNQINVLCLKGRVHNTSSQAPSYASSKLQPSDLLTGVKCRDTSVADNWKSVVS